MPIAISEERVQVEEWREQELIRAGYPPDDAFEFARRTDIDLHRAVRLLRDGCDIETAAQILR